MSDISKKVPLPIRRALDAYAYHFYAQDVGWGSSVDDAEKDWLEEQEKLIKYVDKLKGKK